ncbi:TlyA family RNA methyltransferase [Dolosigranulum pigrum]|uniref:TlyA family RNA methyltransferase n=1 Tax=Dolosigranulum pigrum TaxID=29394 RepID=UPI001AD89615|nr:TlyA family RNA methyltransferase [Dolosigranulum pigrum]QTJ34713.1 TlyA family RNA methyltransferase [Dolosigranulum pigrum]
MSKLRADELLFRQGLADSPKEAAAIIMTGNVFTTKEEKILTAGQQLQHTTELYVKGSDHPYVSRGGLKLKRAVELYNCSLNGEVVLDIGASTGGFTDVALREGARLVYALDVGTNQLVWSLRTHEQVVVMEQTNFRYTTVDDFVFDKPTFATIDVSFISLALILENLNTILPAGSPVIALIKPQFEATRELVTENQGIITDSADHATILQHVCQFMTDLNYAVEGLHPSPITGSKGNIEFISYLKVGQTQQKSIKVLIEQAIEESRHL